jgi:hypothetical protein
LELHSSAAFLQKSKSWPTVPQAIVTVTPAAWAANEANVMTTAAAVAFKMGDFKGMSPVIGFIEAASPLIAKAR